MVVLLKFGQFNNMDKITVGSRAFFSGMEGFYPGSLDFLVLADPPEDFLWRHELYMRGVNTFTYKKEPAAVMIARTIERGDAMLAGKFLVPEVADAIGATVEDILPLEPLLRQLDEKQSYQLAIFESIKENGSFELTPEQLHHAYEIYKEARKPAAIREMEAEMRERAQMILELPPEHYPEE